MGLQITVGAEHNDPGFAESHIKALAGISAGLAEMGFEWREPTNTTLPAGWPYLWAFSYVNLHYLRRVYALVQADEDVTPVSSREEMDEAKDVVEQEALFGDSHLLNHSDCDGYYVPVDWADYHDFPLVGAEVVGSSPHLLWEIEKCAPAIGIEDVDDGWLPDGKLRQLRAEDQSHPFHIERYTWVALYDACRLSMHTGHAIVFH
jgi:hypothetical protein